MRCHLPVPTKKLTTGFENAATDVQKVLPFCLLSLTENMLNNKTKPNIKVPLFTCPLVWPHAAMLARLQGTQQYGKWCWFYKVSYLQPTERTSFGATIWDGLSVDPELMMPCWIHTFCKLDIFSWSNSGHHGQGQFLEDSCAHCESLQLLCLCLCCSVADWHTCSCLFLFLQRRGLVESHFTQHWPWELHSWNMRG